MPRGDAINTGSPAANRQIVNESKQTLGEDIAKKPDDAQKPPAIDYPGGTSLIIIFLFFGKLYAEFHIKWVFLSALLIFEVKSILCATAPTSVALIVGRAVAGIGGAGIVSGALVILSRCLPLHKRPKYTGAMGGSVGIAQITSPTLGGVFTEKITWRWCLRVNLPLGAVTFLRVFFLVKISSDPNRKSNGTLKGFLDKFDLIGTLILIPWVI
ncbi:major facilitator superfamily domain-containing protein [Trichoderma sp. SZMC 28014]